MRRTVFFDVDGVLIHGYHSRPELVRPWDRDMLADTGVDPDRFRQEFIFDIFVKKVIIGETSLIDALQRRLPSFGYRGSAMDFARYWLEKDSVVNEPLLDLVRLLRQRPGLRLYIATNQEHLRASWLWSTLRFGDHFDDMFYSARIGARKPEPAYFDFIHDAIGPQQTPPLFFDDSLPVIDGARRAGWEAIPYNSIADCADHPWIAAELAQCD